jgi:hypothetical protein
MKHQVAHELDIPTAKKVTEKAMESYAERFAQYNPTATWTNETHADIQFSVKGFDLKGSIDLQPKAILLDLDVPLALRLFKKKAIDVIEQEIQPWLDKADQI